jgi:hypothetical protein
MRGIKGDTLVVVTGATGPIFGFGESYSQLRLVTCVLEIKIEDKKKN